MDIEGGPRPGGPVGLPPNHVWSWGGSAPPTGGAWTTAPPQYQPNQPTPATQGFPPLLGVLLGVVLLVAAVGGFLVLGTNAYANDYAGRILAGATIEGVDVGGLTADEAVAAVAPRLTDLVHRQIAVRWGSRSWTTTPADLGVTSDLERVAADLVADSAEVTWRQLARIRWFGAPVVAERTLVVTPPDRQAIAGFVEEIAAEVDVPATDAQLDVSDGTVVVTPDQAGQALDIEATTAALDALLREGGRELEAVVDPVEPAVTAAAFDQVLVLHQREHRLELWQAGVLTHSWPVAVGTSGYPTPTGRFHVTAKRYMPTWVNPAPNGWGRYLPRKIGPGPNNPLGLRALNWSAPGAIRFHGTAAVDSIGRDASHGCVRLRNSDVVELYDLVRERAVIVSLR